MNTIIAAPAPPAIQATSNENLIDISLLPEDLRARLSQYLKIQEKINLFSTIHEKIKNNLDDKHIIYRLKYGFNKYDYYQEIDFDFVRKFYLKGLLLKMTDNKENIILNGNYYRASLKLQYNLVEKRYKDDEGNIKIFSEDGEHRSVLKLIAPRTWKMLKKYDKKNLKMEYKNF